MYKLGKLFSPRSTWLHEEAQIQAFENMMICRGKLLNGQRPAKLILWFARPG